MDVHGLLAPDAGAPLGESRSRVLGLLRAADGPVSVQEIADQSGLHPNTARYHLDLLVDAGMATREPRPQATPGRPSMAYRASIDGPSGQRQYRLLAEMLTSMVTGVIPQPGEAAAEAGREWGRYITEQPPPFQRLDARQAMEKLTAILAEIGFAPETSVAESAGAETRVPESAAGESTAPETGAAESTAAESRPGDSGRQRQLRLHQCPFREVAEQHREVVCALHLGLMQGVLTQLRAPVTADRLLPFAEPGVCIAELTADRAPAG